MLINEVADSSAMKLFGLAEFLTGRANDSSSARQISTDAFIKLANDIGVSLTAQSLQDMAQRPPLSNIIEPIAPNSTVIKFKGNTSDDDVAMPVNKAQDVVASAAKRAASKRN